MKKKIHFLRKTAAAGLTVLAFISSASFSANATDNAIGKDVVIVNDNGKKVTIAKSDIVPENESGKQK